MYGKRKAVVRAWVWSLAVASCGATAWAVTDPPGCFRTGPALFIAEYFDTDNDGIGDTPVNRPKKDGETIYYQSTLVFAIGTGQCAYEGGTLCIDPPGPVPCTDVTPLGGIPKICVGCPVPGVPSVDSLQLPYVVNKGDLLSPAAPFCASEVRGVAEYHDGISHFGPTDVFPIDADTPICNAVQYCGDGIFNPDPPFNEECDDGNTNNTDACRNNCELARCGDAILDPGESCDPPGSPAGAHLNPCRGDCSVCGDGIVQGGDGEQCDDGNTINGDGCNNDCTAPACGNGVIESLQSETCDPPGSLQGNGNSCRSDCTYCGDGVLQGGHSETCDPPGTPSGVNSNPCRLDCTFCGDAIRNGNETCDDANTVSGCDPQRPKIQLDPCQNNCTAPICEDPSKLKFLPSLDSFDAHGRILPVGGVGEIDPVGQTFRVQLTRVDDGLELLSVTLPPGAVTGQAPRFKYKDKAAKLNGGIYKLQILKRPDHYRLTVRAYANVNAADVESHLLIHWFVGSDEWTQAGYWEALGTKGWRLTTAGVFATGP